MYHIYVDGLDIAQSMDEEVALSVRALMASREGVITSFILWEEPCSTGLCNECLECDVELAEVTGVVGTCNNCNLGV